MEKLSVAFYLVLGRANSIGVNWSPQSSLSGWVVLCKLLSLSEVQISHLQNKDQRLEWFSPIHDDLVRFIKVNSKLKSKVLKDAKRKLRDVNIIPSRYFLRNLRYFIIKR